MSNPNHAPAAPEQAHVSPDTAGRLGAIAIAAQDPMGMMTADHLLSMPDDRQVKVAEAMVMVNRLNQMEKEQHDNSPMAGLR